MISNRGESGLVARRQVLRREAHVERADFSVYVAEKEIVLADETTQRVQEKGKTSPAWLRGFIGRHEAERELIAYAEQGRQPPRGRWARRSAHLHLVQFEVLGRQALRWRTCGTATSSSTRTTR